MAEKPTYQELERKIELLKEEALEYMRREREFSAERKLSDYSHLKRTISLMKINEELNREMIEIKRADKKELEQISHKLSGRIRELKCLYEISSFREGSDYSLDGLLQEIIDFIPAACQHPSSTHARIIFDGYEFTTKNFSDTGLKQSFSIAVNKKHIGSLEVFRLEKKSEPNNKLLLEEESLFAAIAESISRVIEREWAEAEIRSCRNRIEQFIKQTDVD